MNAVRSPWSWIKVGGSERRSSPTPPTALPVRRSVNDAYSPSLADDADLGVERDAEVGVHALPGEIHESQDVAGGRASPIDDEIGVLGRDLGAVDPLALETDLLDEAPGDLAGGVLPHTAGRGQRQRLGGLLPLEPLLDVRLDLGEGAAMELEPTADEHGPDRRLERPVGERRAARLELPDGAVGMEEVHGGDEVADGTVLRARVHGQRAADRGGNA